MVYTCTTKLIVGLNASFHVLQIFLPNSKVELDKLCKF